MKIEKLIAIANTGYSDHLVQGYFEDPEGEHGDTLAEFIARELQETLDPDANDTDQLFAAMDKMEKAQAEIGGVIQALDAALAAVK